MKRSASPAASASAWQPAFWMQHPGFASIASAAARCCDWPDWPAAEAYYAALSAAAPVQFVGVDVQSYEDHIAETGQVPTRYACWHDLFNALIWQQFPASKTALNRLHQSAKLQLGNGQCGNGQRGRRRDAATLFDENGAVVVSSDPDLLGLIRNMNWPELFVAQRTVLSQRMQVFLFGHGLLDQLRQPFLGLTAHALLLHEPALAELTPAALDARVAETVAAKQTHWTPAELFPLPILGMPDWWPGNADPTFYDNTHYFRRERRRQASANGSA